jgi:uncharacterized Fe-S center protein
MSQSDTPTAPAGSAGTQVRVRMDERNMTTSYANAFRMHRTNEELLVDVGLNLVLPPQQGSDASQGGQDVLFQVNNRLVLNYATAKRLAMALGQIVRQHEQQHGEIALGGEARRGN